MKSSPAETALDAAHFDHLTDEGFSAEQIWKMEKFGVKSLTAKEASSENFKVWNKQRFISEAGLKLPFTETFSQIRFNQPIARDNGKPAKYLTPLKAKSQAYIPDGCKIITEGFKDAWSGKFHGGIPTGAIAGVSHTVKALPAGCGHNFLFDSDGWHNPQVMAMLLLSAFHTGGKVQLIPEIEGQPKAGLCEYFKAGYGPDDYAELVAKAMYPDQLIYEWIKRWKNYRPDIQARCTKIALTYTLKYGDAAA